MNRDEFHAKLAEHGLTQYESEIGALAKPCIRLYLTKADDDNIPVGASKIGGLPDLPDSLPWPYEEEFPVSAKFRYIPQKPKSTPDAPLSFIAQIALADAKPFDEEDLLPSTGFLYFFYSNRIQVWGMQPEDNCGFKVLYYDGTLGELRRREMRDVTIKIFGSAQLKPCSELSFSMHLDPGFPSSEESDTYFNLIDEFGIYKMLGIPNTVHDPMERDCEMIRQTLYPEPALNKEEWKRATRESAKDWRLLLQVDSDRDTGIMWGDAGLLYFWIRKDDLLRSDFAKAWVILQCS